LEKGRDPNAQIFIKERETFIDSKLVKYTINKGFIA